MAPFKFRNKFIQGKSYHVPTTPTEHARHPIDFPAATMPVEGFPVKTTATEM